MAQPSQGAAGATRRSIARTESAPVSTAAMRPSASRTGAATATTGRPAARET